MVLRLWILVPLSAARGPAQAAAASAGAPAPATAPLAVARGPGSAGGRPPGPLRMRERARWSRVLGTASGQIHAHAKAPSRHGNSKLNFKLKAGAPQH